MREIVLTDAPDQEFSTILAGQRCRLRFRYSPTTERFSFDLDIGDRPALRGRRVVLGVDLLAPFALGIGRIFAAEFEGRGALPTKAAIAERRVRIYHVTEAEIAEAFPS